MEAAVPTPSEEKIIQYFTCANCSMREKYEYFGKDPPFYKKYKLMEEVYSIEDPFLPPRQGNVLILGAHCIKCSHSICKDTQCSFFYDGTYCIQCAKLHVTSFPKPVQEKLNRIVVN